MIFPTPGFAFFFLCVFVGFWYVFRRSLDRKIFLVAVSYLFYAFWDWRFCFLLLGCSAASYAFGLLIGRQREYRWRKLLLALSTFLNLLVLAFFKYYNFFADRTNGLILRYSAGEAGFLFPALSVVMPVGISFYVFKSMSYVFDVYLCKLPPVKNPIDILLYVSFFPQLASGPIVHAVDFVPQIDGAVAAGIEPGSRPIPFARASALLVSGLLKKMVFANFISTLFVDPVFADPSLFNALEVFLAAVGYSVVIYTDFSGYSDMAIGIALLLGFKTPDNFNRPYLSFSVTEFWKRWHITFSSWLKNYLYFSLGGSRFGLVRTLFALVFTMILGGLWHGASISFVIWGAMQGLALAVERAAGYGTRRSPVAWKAALQILATFTFVTLSWLVFRSPSTDFLLGWYRALGNFSAPITLLSPLVGLLLAAGLGMHAIPRAVRVRAMNAWIAVPVVLKGVFLCLFLVFLSIVSMSGIPPFIYFQF